LLFLHQSVLRIQSHFPVWNSGFVELGPLGIKAQILIKVQGVHLCVKVHFRVSGSARFRHELLHHDRSNTLFAQRF
jgi:hypothetical protein